MHPSFFVDFCAQDSFEKRSVFNSPHLLCFMQLGNRGAPRFALLRRGKGGLGGAIFPIVFHNRT
jgi:hypothetical protein